MSHSKSRESFTPHVLLILGSADQSILLTSTVIPYDLVYSARNFVPILGLSTREVALYKRAKLH